MSGEAIHPDGRVLKKSCFHVPCHPEFEVLSRGVLLPTGLAISQKIPGFKIKEVFLE